MVVCKWWYYGRLFYLYFEWHILKWCKNPKWQFVGGYIVPEHGTNTPTPLVLSCFRRKIEVRWTRLNQDCISCVFVEPVKNIKSRLWEEIQLLIKNDLLPKDLKLSTVYLRFGRVELDAVSLQGIWIRFLWLSLSSLHPWTSGWDGVYQHRGP